MRHFSSPLFVHSCIHVCSELGINFVGNQLTGAKSNLRCSCSILLIQESCSYSQHCCQTSSICTWVAACLVRITGYDRPYFTIFHADHNTLEARSCTIVHLPFRMFIMLMTSNETKTLTAQMLEIQDNSFHLVATPRDTHHIAVPHNLSRHIPQKNASNKLLTRVQRQVSSSKTSDLTAIQQTIISLIM